MPNDLEDLASQTEHRNYWGATPPPGGLRDLASQQQMTHQPEQPNPAAPYLQGAREFARRTFVEPLQATGFLPGGQNWGRGAVNDMLNFNQGGLTGLFPSIRQSMPGFTNSLGDLVQSPAARNVFSTANIGGMPLVQGIQDVRAFHASPYNFNKFDISRIGSGEGNTLRGYGLYFGENPGVSGPGGHYDQQFTAQNLGKYELNKIESGILRALRAGHSDMEIASALLDRHNSTAFPISWDVAMAAVDRIRGAKSTIYDTLIKAPPDHFVDWDLPIDQQSQYVRIGLRRAFGDRAFANQRVGDVIKNMDEIAAAKRLRDVGVPGFKFHDQLSRMGQATRKTFNFVVSDDNLLNIMSKMGIAGISALPGLGIWHYQQHEGEQ